MVAHVRLGRSTNLKSNPVSETTHIKLFSDTPLLSQVVTISTHHPQALVAPDGFFRKAFEITSVTITIHMLILCVALLSTYQLFICVTLIDGSHAQMQVLSRNYRKQHTEGFTDSVMIICIGMK